MTRHKIIAIIKYQMKGDRQMVRCNKMKQKIAYYSDYQDYDYIVAEMGVHYQVGRH